MPFSNKSVLPVLPKNKNTINESSENLSLSSIEDKELRKKLRNRQSALAARERKKARMLELEKQVATLQESKKRLHEENQALRLRVDVLTQKCLDAGLPCESAKDVFLRTHRSARIQSKYSPDNKYSNEVSGHPGFNSETFAQQSYFVPQESYFQGQFLRVQSSQRTFREYSSYQMKLKAYENTKEKREQSAASLLSCNSAGDQAHENSYPYLQSYPVEIENRANQPAVVKLEGFNQMSVAAGFTPSPNGANQNWMNSNEAIRLEDFDQLPSIGVLWETGQRLPRRDTKAQSKLSLEHHLPFACKESFYPSSEQSELSGETNSSCYRKLKSFHSADEILDSSECPWSSCSAKSCLFQGTAANNLPSADKSNRASLSTLPSPENGLQNDFSDFSILPQNCNEMTDSMNFDFASFKEEANELLSSRSDSGVSMDEYPYWATDHST